MVYLAYALSLAAIVVMAVNVIQAFKLKRAIVGGEVGEKWSLLTTLIAVFFVGYLLSPLALYFQIPSEYLNLLVFGVFLFGAVFVMVVIGIIRQALSFMDLLK
jgi:hypothetical protein